MRNNDDFEIFLIMFAIITIVCFLSLTVLTFKYRSLEDRYAELATRVHHIETRQINIQSNIPLKIEPSDDEIKISINGEDLP